VLANGERQVAPDISGIRRDHVARYEFAARLIGRRARVIDVACGIGYGSALLADAGATVLGIDRNAEAIAYGKQHYFRRRVTLTAGDAADIGATGYNAAVCFETIEHLADPLPMLKALRRAAPLLIASVPNEAVFPHRNRIKFHYRHYTREAFSALIEAAGYEITGWFGQEGPHSDVQPDIEGRTLVVTAKRAKAKRPQKSATEAPPAPKSGPDHVAIVGLGPSCATFFEVTRRLGGVSAYCDEVWGINAIGDVLRCDRVFHMDDLLVQEARAAARPDSNIAAMVRWLKTHPGPVYTSRLRPGYVGLVEFPLEEVLNGGADGNGGAPYFNSTAAYAIAWAIHIGVKHISLFGLDYTLANSHHAEQGRACCEFWLGIAAARGIEITIPDTSSLMDACATDRDRLYGYDCVDVILHPGAEGGVKVQFVDRADMPTADDIEAKYDHTRHPNRLVSAETT